MTRKVIMDEEGESSGLTPDVFNEKVISIQTTMSREEVEHMQKYYVEEGFGIQLHPGSKMARVNRPPEGSKDFYVYYDQFRLGLHFPVCLEFAEVLNHYGIVLAQLVPNSVASIMSFIIYLRRIEHPWSLEYFHQHFYCEIGEGGYVTFLTTTALSIVGLESRTESWKEKFCRVTSLVDLDIPREPSKERVAAPTAIDEAPKNKAKIVLDIRQYVKDRQLLKRVLYSGKYTKMSAEDWEESDRALANLPAKGRLHKEPVGRAKSVKKLMNVIDTDLPKDLAAIEAGVPSTSAAGARVGEAPLMIEGAPQGKKRKLAHDPKGKRPMVETGATAAYFGEEFYPDAEDGPRKINDKVTLDLKNEKVTVDLSKEWFPAGSCPEGVAQSMGLVLYSDYFGKRITGASLNSIRDQLARHNAAAWSIGNYMGIELEKDRARIAELEKRVLALESSNQLLAHINNQKGKQMAVDKARHDQYVKDTSAMLETLTKANQEYKQKMEVVKSSNRRLRTSVKELEASSAESIRGGIALCLDQLSRANAVHPEWDDADKIEALVIKELKAAEGGAEKTEKEDTERSEDIEEIDE